MTTKAEAELRVRGNTSHATKALKKLKSSAQAVGSVAGELQPLVQTAADNIGSLANESLGASKAFTALGDASSNWISTVSTAGPATAAFTTGIILFKAALEHAQEQALAASKEIERMTTLHVIPYREEAEKATKATEDLALALVTLQVDGMAQVTVAYEKHAKAVENLDEKERLVAEAKQRHARHEKELIALAKIRDGMGAGQARMDQASLISLADRIRILPDVIAADKKHTKGLELQAKTIKTELIPSLKGQLDGLKKIEDFLEGEKSDADKKAAGKRFRRKKNQQDKDDRQSVKDHLKKIKDNRERRWQEKVKAGNEDNKFRRDRNDAAAADEGKRFIKDRRAQEKAAAAGRKALEKAEKKSQAIRDKAAKRELAAKKRLEQEKADATLAIQEDMIREVIDLTASAVTESFGLFLDAAEQTAAGEKVHFAEMAAGFIKSVGLQIFSSGVKYSAEGAFNIASGLLPGGQGNIPGGIAQLAVGASAMAIGGSMATTGAIASGAASKFESGGGGGGGGSGGGGRSRGRGLSLGAATAGEGGGMTMNFFGSPNVIGETAQGARAMERARRRGARRNLVRTNP